MTDQQVRRNTDLSWVTKTAVVKEGDPAHQAMLDNPGWALLYVTGGLYGPVEFVHGWPVPERDGTGKQPLSDDEEDAT